MDAKIDYNIDQRHLDRLFLMSKEAYGENITIEKWLVECKKAYVSYYDTKEFPKTFFFWVVGQIEFLQNLKNL